MFNEPYIGMPIDWSTCDKCDITQSPRYDAPMESDDYCNMTLCSLPIAMSYVPFQQWKTVYSLEKGLARGTIFPELDLPFKGGMRR